MYPPTRSKALKLKEILAAQRREAGSRKQNSRNAKIIKYFLQKFLFTIFIPTLFVEIIRLVIVYQIL